MKEHVQFVINELKRHNINPVRMVEGRGRKGTTFVVEALVNGKHIEKTISIKKSQVRNNAEYWILNDPNITVFAESSNNVYVLVDNANKLHIVPSKAVKVATDIGHTTWLNCPSKTGRKHNDGDVRHYFEPSGAYINNFEELKR